jgi:cytochrome P450
MTIDYDPFSEAVRQDPHPFYRQLRESAPVYYMPKYDAWALSRFQDIWDASANDALSAARGTTPAQLLTKDQPVAPMLNLMDPPEHTQLRSVIRKCFLPKHVREVEAVAKKLVAEYLDDLADRDSFDAIGDLAARLSVTIACLAIGIPAEEGPMLTKLVQRFFHHDPDSEGMTQTGLAALDEISRFCEDLVRERRKAPVDSPAALDALFRFEIGGRHFTDAEAGSHVSMLVIGGSETFPKVLASALVRLAEYPDQRTQLVRDPTGIPDAFNEVLRFDMPTQFLGRTAVRDIEIQGQAVKTEQSVIFLYASANRDDREFDDPDIFDINRRAPRMLSFGAGNHQCLGTHVARMEGKVCLEAILSRFPDYAVSTEDAVRLRTEFVQGYATLPIHKEA